MRPRARRGFALVELLIALAIFSVVAILAYGALATIVRTRTDLALASGRMRDVQLAVAMLERDLRQAAARPVRGLSGETMPALAGGMLALELTHAGFARPQSEARSTLSRTAYSAAGETLQRRSFAVLDRAPGSQAVVRDLCDQLESVRFRYLDRSGNWRDSWPPRNGVERGDDSLPRAVEFRLALRDWGEISRLVELPDGPAPVVLEGGAP